MTRIPLETRKRVIARMPWAVRLLIPAEHCDGIKWGTVALKDLYEHGPRSNPSPARGIQERSKCKRRGEWQYVAAKPRDPYTHVATSGTYCWTHMWSEILNHPTDYARYMRWIRDNLPSVGSVATHRFVDLDPRLVSRISDDYEMVWLSVGTGEIGPYPATNYRYAPAAVTNEEHQP